MNFEICVDENIDLKTFLLKNGFSARTTAKLLKEKKDIFINEKVYSVNYNLVVGDRVKVNIIDKTCNVKPVNLPIDIVYENEYFLVVNKPKNLATIPTISHYNDNLSGRVKSYFISKNIDSSIHAVNRLDYLTSGLVVFAKSSAVQNAFSKTKITKKYQCLCSGVFDKKSGVIEAKIGRKNGSVIREVSPNGKDAKTFYSVIKEENGNSLLDIELFTGRTHQIRVHMAYVSHPLVGDNLYGKASGNFYLNAYYLAFIFPLDNKQYSFNIKN